MRTVSEKAEGAKPLRGQDAVDRVLGCSQGVGFGHAVGVWSAWRKECGCVGV